MKYLQLNFLFRIAANIGSFGRERLIPSGSHAFLKIFKVIYQFFFG
ncbi:hypothetical protein P689_12244 [Candidatus Riesia pediculischaeffi PTSU]|uniref:Uncharacterized protein n=1 Tax=Candidatus Riesia pediculischaeffi PTSU TaxID=1401651 RepID=A0A0C1VJ71_9ENTR|nr:hypothetical protein P689_12244 [Candidatus Riesia pediculischaeffi PTSU]